jgi:hypothetical protein
VAGRWRQLVDTRLYGEGVLTRPHRTPRTLRHRRVHRDEFAVNMRNCIRQIGMPFAGRTLTAPECSRSQGRKSHVTCKASRPRSAAQVSRATTATPRPASAMRSPGGTSHWRAAASIRRSLARAPASDRRSHSPRTLVLPPVLCSLNRGLR